ncbi:MAG: pyridoxamine 5'-phosphate oxidase family protein [Candidatus Eremiobacteraeota bacterium]|nr:pyridoxamine 5'-phosphate oxidase family protein [Candidatus Eremiobacteraeota bacterium]
MNIVKADSMTELLGEEQVRVILSEPLLMRLAYEDAEGWPVVQPVWFIFQDGQLLTTVEKGSRKAVRLQADNRCYFTIDTSGEGGTYGVRGRAHVSQSTDQHLAERILRASLRKYLGSEEGPTAEALLQDIAEGNLVVLHLQPVKYAAWKYPA